MAKGRGKGRAICCDHEFGSDHLLNIRPYKDRGCTDILFLLGFVLFWVGLWVVAGQALAQGEPVNIAYAVDMYGRTCGIHPDVVDKPLGAWPYPLQYSPKVCVASCNETLVYNNPDFTFPYPTEEFMGAYCVPPAENVTQFIDYILSQNLTALDATGVDFSSGAKTLQAAVSDVYTARVTIGMSVLFAVAASFGYIFVLKTCAGFMVWVMIVLSIFLGYSVGLALVLESGDTEANYAPDVQKTIMWAGYIILIVTTLYVLVIIFLRKRIQIAIEVIKEAAGALKDMPMMVAYPMWPILALTAFLVYWLIISLYIYSASVETQVETPDEVKFQYFVFNTDFVEDQCSCNISDPIVYANAVQDALTSIDPNDFTTWPFEHTNWHDMETYTYLAWNEDLKNTFAVHFFGLLWNVQFIIYFTYLVMAVATSEWYFTPKSEEQKKAILAAEAEFAQREGWTEDQKNEMGSHEPNSTPLSSASRLVCRFHLGSVAFASLLIAIVQFMRAMVHYFEHMSKTKENPIQKAVFCCIKCCLRCVECCLDKISKNALIWIAVFGDSFASSACSSFKLLFTNMARVAAINMVADYLLFIGKVLVMCFTGAVGAYWVSSDPNISSPILPTIIMLFIGYIVGQMFMIIFENVVDTIFLCFLMDESRNKGKAGGMLAGNGLQDLVNDHAHASAALAAYQKAGSPEEAKALKSNYKAAYGGKVDPSQLPAEADLDGDGVISEAEAKAHRKGETSD